MRFYRELGIYDLYRREVPAGTSFGCVIEREELARRRLRMPQVRGAARGGPVPLFCGTHLAPRFCKISPPRCT